MSYEILSIGLTPDFQFAETDPMVVKGHAAVFNTESRVGDWWRVMIAPGAFKKTIKERDQHALFNHDDGKVLGRRLNGTLELSEDESGLFDRISLPDTSVGRDTWESVKRGDITGQSIGFWVMKEIWEESETDIPLRTIIEIKLEEVSIVTFPQFPETDINAEFARNHKILTPDKVLLRAFERGELKRNYLATTVEPSEGNHTVITVPEPVHHSTAGKDEAPPEKKPGAPGQINWKHAIEKRRIELARIKMGL